MHKFEVNMCKMYSYLNMHVAGHACYDFDMGHACNQNNFKYWKARVCANNFHLLKIALLMKLLNYRIIQKLCTK